MTAGVAVILPEQLRQFMQPLVVDPALRTHLDIRWCACGHVVRTRSRDAGNAAMLDHVAAHPEDRDHV